MPGLLLQGVSSSSYICFTKWLQFIFNALKVWATSKILLKQENIFSAEFLRFMEPWKKLKFEGNIFECFVI